MELTVSFPKSTHIPPYVHITILIKPCKSYSMIYYILKSTLRNAAKIITGLSQKVNARDCQQQSLMFLTLIHKYCVDTYQKEFIKELLYRYICMYL